MCGSRRKYSYSPHERLLEILEERGVLKAKLFKVGFNLKKRNLLSRECEYFPEGHNYVVKLASGNVDAMNIN